MQPSTIAPAVRIRENQRRARVRRKELIDELTSRVRNYETQGVTATIQVQEAARKVLLENRQLRALLAERGVSTVEVEAFLHPKIHDASFTAALPTQEPADIIGTQSQAAPPEAPEQPAEMRGLNATNQLLSAASPPITPIDIGFRSVSEAGEKGECIGPSNGTRLLRHNKHLEKDLEGGNPLPNLLSPISDCYCPEIDPVPHQAQSSETECSAAANILASFRGHGDVERARAELGCPENAECSITNVALLHALDSEHASNTQSRNAHTMVTR